MPMPNAIWSARIKTIIGIDKQQVFLYDNKAIPIYGLVKVSTGILKLDKRGVPSNHEKGSTLKLNADENVALAA